MSNLSIPPRYLIRLESVVNSVLSSAISDSVTETVFQLTRASMYSNFNLWLYVWVLSFPQRMQFRSDTVTRFILQLT